MILNKKMGMEEILFNVKEFIKRDFKVWKHDKLQIIFILFGDGFKTIWINCIVIVPIEYINFDLFFAPVNNPIFRYACFAVYLSIYADMPKWHICK